MTTRLFATLSLIAIALPVSVASAQEAGDDGLTSRQEVVRTMDANFKRFDADSNGALSKAEIDAAHQRARQQTAAAIGQRLEQEFGKIDTNKDGQLSLAEFKAAAPAPRAASADNTLTKLDVNKDGKITAAEFTNPVLNRFDRIDADRDGQLQPEERRRRTPAPAGR